MKTLKKMFAVAWMTAGLALMSGCADSLTQPQSQTGLRDEAPVLLDAFAFDTKSGTQVVNRTAPLAYGQGVKALISNTTGGWLHLPQANLHVYVPAGALPLDEMVIALRAYAGSAVAWEFYPHGTQFKKPLQVYVDVLGTDLAYMQDSMASQSMADAVGVYWEGWKSTAWPAEFFDVRFQNNTKGTDQVWFKTDHFSGYAIAM